MDVSARIRIADVETADDVVRLDGCACRRAKERIMPRVGPAAIVAVHDASPSPARYRPMLDATLRA